MVHEQSLFNSSRSQPFSPICGFLHIGCAHRPIPLTTKHWSCSRIDTDVVRAVPQCVLFVAQRCCRDTTHALAIDLIDLAFRELDKLFRCAMIASSRGVRLRACVPACVRACLPACVLVCSSPWRGAACVRACVLVCSSPSRGACVRACLRACVRAYVLVCSSPSGGDACVRACVRVCVRACLYFFLLLLCCFLFFVEVRSVGKKKRTKKKCGKLHVL